METMLITKDDIKQLFFKIGINIFIDKVIEELTNAFLNFDPSQTDVRQRDGFHFHGLNPGVLEWMPVTETNRATIKMVSYSPNNPSLYNIPTIISTISLFNVETGHLIALADGIFLTAIRTGAATAIASKILAKEDSEIIGLIGCGAQAVTQLHALSRIFKIKKVYIYDIDNTAALSFLHRCNFLNLDICIATREILEAESDIICTATSVPIGQGPVLNDSYLKKHIHINSIGADLPGKTEIPLNLLKRSLVCPDFLPQALIEGECQQLTRTEIGPDIIELVKQPHIYEKFRTSETVFDSTGFALEDQIAMNILFELITDNKLGQKVNIETIASDPRNPYDFMKKSYIENKRYIHEHSNSEEAA